VGTYVIAGKGDVSQEILTAGLNDLPGLSLFYVPWIGSQNTRPSEGLRKVYDYLVDGERNFILLAKDKASVHPTIAEAADEVVESGSSSPELHFDVIPSDATALILWSDEEHKHSEGLVCAYFDRGHTLLDLTNGLTPIMVADGDELTTTPPVDQPDSPIQEDEIPPLTEEDIAAMPEGVRKQLDRSLGADEIGSLTDGEVEAKVLEFVRGEKEVDESAYATVVVVLPTGRSFVTSVPLLNLWGLLNSTVWDE